MLVVIDDRSNSITLTCTIQELETMKSIRKKFKKCLPVKPLYKKVTSKNKISSGTICDLNHKDNELDGHGINLKRNVLFDNNSLKEISVENITNIITSESNRRKDLKAKGYNNVNNDLKANNSVRKQGMDKEGNPNEIIIDDNTNVPTNSSKIEPFKEPDTWLRVYPARRLPEETLCATVYRHVFCQIGLITLLVMWTLIWYIVIHKIEGPHEMKVMEEFEYEQRQLIIDLATELRQITPLSPKWRMIIEKRIEQERLMTINAVAKGARLHPGYFWDGAGTFLFLVYVMTCLGFGAPVPQTVAGRCAALAYAIGAVPTQLFLMMHASKLTVAKVVKFERYLVKMGKNLPLQDEVGAMRTLHVMKHKLQQYFACTMRVLCIGHCIPIAITVYYTLGAVVFGVARGRTGLELVLFPLEFTTTGGLEHVIGYVRTLYAFYVEGAMSLLAWSLATFRKHSQNHLADLIDRLRLVKREE